MPTALYNFIAVVSWPVLHGVFRLRRARAREPPRRGRVRARGEPHLELRPVAAGAAALAEAAAALHGARPSSSTRSSARPPRRGRVPGPSRRGRRRSGADGRRPLPRRRRGGDVPGGDPAAEGPAQEVRAQAASRLCADRAGGRRAARPCGDQGHGPAVAPAKLQVAYGEPVPVDDLGGAAARGPISLPPSG